MIKLHSEPLMVLSDYKKTSLYFSVGLECTMKCMNDLKQINYDISECDCHNSELLKNKPIEFTKEYLEQIINKNPFINSYVMGGLEPLDSFNNLIKLIELIRSINNDDIVIYTGYYEHEVENKINTLKQYSNIIMKFGRFNPQLKPKFDKVLGVTLISSNQYGKKI